MQKTLLRILVLASLLTAGISKADDSFQVMTEDFPPFNYFENGNLIGVGPDVVREIMKRLGHKEKIKVMGWKRAYELASTQPNKVLFSMARIKEREKKFHWVGPIMSVTDYFYANEAFARDQITREEAKSIGGILVQEGGAHHQLLAAEGFKNLLPYTNISNQVRLLTIGRGTLLQINDLTIAYQMKRQGLDLNLVKPVLELQRSELYIAFSLKTDAEIISRWRQALVSMKIDGTLEEIETRYKQ